jgi:hypothetical protein
MATQRAAAPAAAGSRPELLGGAARGGVSLVVALGQTAIFVALAVFAFGMLDVMVRGHDVEAIWLPMLILLCIAAVFAVIAGRVFHWET